MKLSVTVIALLSLGDVLSTPASAQVPSEVAALVKKHCVDCHGGKEPDAGLDLAQLKFDLSDPRASSTWVRVHDKLEAGEMPPPEADQPSRDERRAALGALHKTLHAASLAQQEAEGRVALRRLNRTQHENTLNDLLGVSIKLDDVLPDDGSVAGFDNVSEGLDVSSSHLVLYQQAADMALDAAMATRPAKNLAGHATSLFPFSSSFYCHLWLIPARAFWRERGLSGFSALVSATNIRSRHSMRSGHFEALVFIAFDLDLVKDCSC